MIARKSIPAALVVLILVGQAMGAIGIFDGSLDLGRPGDDPLLPGSAVFGGGMYTVTGAGSDWWGAGEYAHFVHKLIGGDFRIEADVVWQGAPDAGNEWKKAGVAIRNDIETGAGNEKEVNFITAVTRPNVNRGTFQWRLDPAANMGNTNIGGVQPTKVALQRCYDLEGDAFVEGFVDRGAGWERVDGRWAFNLNDSVYVGLFVTSHNNVTETAEFTNVQFVDPVCPTEFPRKPGEPVWDPERIGPVVGGWGVLEVVDNGNMSNLRDAVASLESATGTRYSYSLMGPINMNDSSPQADAKNFPGDGPYGVVSAAIKPAGAVDDIAFLARGQVMIPQTGDWSFYINSDDGDELSVDNRALVIGSESWNTNSFATLYLTAGPHNIQVIHREKVDRADIEVAAAKGATTDLFNFRLIGSGDPGLPEVQSRVPGLASGAHIWQSLPGESGQITNLAQAFDAMNTSWMNGTDSPIVDTLINHSDPDDRGSGNNAFGGDHDNPYDQVVGAGTPDDDFAVFVAGEIHIQTAGTYYIGYNSDDGAQLTILGSQWSGVVEDATGTAQIVGSTHGIGDTLRTDALTGWSWTVGEIYLDAGSRPFEMLMFERGGGAFVELFGGSVPGVYGLLMEGDGRIIVTPAVAPALDLVRDAPWCLEAIPGDLNDDCKMDFFDIAIICLHWLECNLVPASTCW